MAKQITHYEAEICYKKNSNLKQNVRISVGNYNDENATDEEREIDEQTFFWIEQPEEIGVLMDEDNSEDFYVVKAIPVFEDITTQAELDEMKSYHYIYCQTVSGEGYSEPSFYVYTDKKQAEDIVRLNIKEYEADGYLVNENAYMDFNLQKDEEENEEDVDYIRIRLIRVLPFEFYLIKYFEPNEVQVLGEG